METRDVQTLVHARPAHGEPVRRCLNCGTDLLGPFCHVCGQEGVDQNLTLGHLLRDFLGDVFSFDGRFVRTLRPLFTRPGALTQWYVAGHRVPFVPPVRLYVFSSFLLFFVIALLNIDVGTGMVQSGEGQTRESRAFTPDERAELEAEIDSLQQVLGFTVAPPPDSAGVGTDTVPPDSSYATLMGVDVSGSQIGQFFTSRGRRILDDPRAFQDRLASRIPLLLFLLVPVFAAELKLLYLRRRRLYVQHLIFALHLHAFAFGVLTLLLLLSPFDWWGFSLLLFAIPVYLFLAMRRVYAQSRFRTFFKMSVLGVLHTISVACALVTYVFVQLALF